MNGGGPACLRLKVILNEDEIKKVNKNLIDTVHKYILGNLKPNLTFVLKMKISKTSTHLIKSNSNAKDYYGDDKIKIEDGYIDTGDLIEKKKRFSYVEIDLELNPFIGEYLIVN